jgi:ABC-2 type transport system ATP-binding protein
MLYGTDSYSSRSDTQVLSAENLRKSYGPRAALRGLSFSLMPGRVLGFLGPNGAGKTTAIRILTTIMQPDSGSFMVDGIRSDDPEKIRGKIGVLPESLGFPKHITGSEYLTYYGRLYGRTAADAQAKGRALLDEMGLQERGRSLIGSYSRGMKQRLGIARALVNEPVVVFLDEPTLGLDPRGQQELLELVRSIAHERDVGVVLCSHALSEIEDYCDDVVILSSGQIVAAGTVADIIGRAQRSGNAIRILVPSPSIAIAHDIMAAMPNVMSVTRTIGERTGLLRAELAGSPDTMLSDGQHFNNSILEALIRADVPILSFEAEGGRLQDVFLDLTEGNIK